LKLSQLAARLKAEEQGRKRQEQQAGGEAGASPTAGVLVPSSAPESGAEGGADAVIGQREQTQLEFVSKFRLGAGGGGGEASGECVEGVEGAAAALKVKCTGLTQTLGQL
jgi:hypothetical protein